MRSVFPFLTLSQSIHLLRIGVAIVFFLHAIVRIINGSIPQFADFLNGKGLVIGTAIVWVLTVYEILGSILLALNTGTRWLCAGFIIILITGIILIHAGLGWFVGEHGSGGVEYSFILILALLLIAANSRERSA